MKAIQFANFGEPDVLKLVELAQPEPGEGEVLVRVRAAGVNPVDFKIRRGRLEGFLPSKLPAIPGWDMAGDIVSRGHGASRFEAGDAVFGYCRRPWIEKGCYTEYMAVPECYLARKPAPLSYEQAAAVPLAGLTAYQSLFDAGKLQRGQRLAVLGGSGGVGSFALQLGRLTGAHVTAVASERNHAYMKELGANECVSYDQSDWLPALKSRGLFDLVFDCVGGELTEKAYDLCKSGGALVSILKSAAGTLAADKGIRHEYVFVAPSARQLEILREHFEHGRLQAPALETLPLSEAVRAHEQIEKLHTRGKIVLQIG
ncbi:MAG: NADP-dependent oxidoreductase [Leptospirales bacterium]|nr:NADP-dependent oxidoreductase [Leptospirales bacterium]